MSQNLTPTKNNRRKRSSGGFLKQSFFITDDDRVIDPEEEKKLKAKQESEIKQEPEIKESEKKQDESEIKQESEKKQKIEINPEIQIETPMKKEEAQVEKKKKRMSDRILQLLNFDEEPPVSQTDNSPVEKRKRVKFSVFKKEQSTPTPSSFIKNDKTPEQLFRETQFRKKEKRIPLMPGDINNQEEATFSGSGILFFNFWVNPF
jgi:hypothetical protein